MKKQIIGAILFIMILVSINSPLVSSSFASSSLDHQSSDDAPTESNEGSFASTGIYLKIGIDSYAHYGDFSIGYGFQYPHGYEHAAVAWWGEGFTFGYLVDGTEFVATSYESEPFGGLSFVSESVIRDDEDEAIYQTVLRSNDGCVELVHNFRFPKTTKFVILNVTIRNVGPSTLNGVRYRRVWDFDMDNSVDGKDGFNVDLSRNMLYAWEMHYAALAASSFTPPNEWDVYAWDDLDGYFPGTDTYSGPFPVFGDYCVRLEWIYESLPPGASFSIVMFHIGGDSKDDLDNSYALAESLMGPQVPQILSISPNYGGNTGTVTTKIRGMGFSHGAIPKLVRTGCADIIGLETIVIGTSLINTKFNLTNAEQGIWNLTVALPDGTELSLENAFTIYLGGEPVICIDIIGREQIRVGQTGTYYIRVHNKGTIDSGDTAIDVKVDEALKIMRVETMDGIIVWDRAWIEGNITETQTLFPEFWEGAPEGIVEKFLNNTFLWVPSIAPGGFIDFKLTVYAKSPWSGDDPIAIVAVLGVIAKAALVTFATTFTSNFIAQSYYVYADPEKEGNIVQALWKALQRSFDETVEDIKSLFTWAQEGLTRFTEWLVKSPHTFELFLVEAGVSWEKAIEITHKLSDPLQKYAPVLSKIGYIAFGIEVLLDFYNKYNMAKNLHKPPETTKEKAVTPVWAWDPNAKAGPEGYGPEGYVSQDSEMVYIIYFENLENATAPAQKVVITDMLDSDLDWESFCWEEASFGGRVIPPNQEIVELGPDLQVRISKTIDKINGLATWVFETVNSTTGLPPEDPLVGFLPPNKHPPEGEGWVKYRIKIKPDALHNSEIRNKAVIKFDENPPIETNEVVNTIDSVPPESYVLPLPTESPISFEVCWTGSDEDSGIKEYTIWFSKDGGPWVVWFPLTRETSAVFTGEPGHTYAFYSIAHDNVGNVETSPTLPDAITTIPPDATPPKSTLIIGLPQYTDIGGNLYVTYDTPFTLIADDYPDGTGVRTIFYRISNNTYDTSWMEYSETFYLKGLVDGEYSIDYYSVDNIGNTEPTNTVIVILDSTPPDTTLTIGEPKYTSDKVYITPDTPLTLEAADAGSGVSSIAYRIFNSDYDSGWQTYTGPFNLTGLADGVYTIEFNSTDNLGNTETTNSVQITIFSWNYIFTDSYGRGTILKINPAYNFIQFITPDKDYGIREATYMRQCGRTIIIKHNDGELRLITAAVDTKLDFCVTTAWDQQTGKRYFLIDKVGNE
ncbi:MAG: hypothetical protein QXR45_16520 [Candidatus Bathyarchaeia archaeon]